MTAVLPPDLDSWLVTQIREYHAARDVVVDVATREPTDMKTPLARPLIIVRDDSGPRLDQVRFDRSLGISVLFGPRSNGAPAKQLARLTAAFLWDPDIAHLPGSPIAHVVEDGCLGPYRVDDPHNVARWYLTCEYTAVGSW